MGCVFGRAAASSSAAPKKKWGKGRSSPQPEAGSPSAVAATDGDGRPRRRLGGRRASGPRQGCVHAAAAAEQLAAGWPPWLVAVAGEALRGWAPRRADTFEKLNKVGENLSPEIWSWYGSTVLIRHSLVVLALSGDSLLDRIGHVQQRVPGEGHRLWPDRRS
jgi:cyclin-dependent kinase 12/13